MMLLCVVVLLLRVIPLRLLLCLEVVSLIDRKKLRIRAAPELGLRGQQLLESLLSTSNLSTSSSRQVRGILCGRQKHGCCRTYVLEVETIASWLWLLLLLSEATLLRVIQDLLQVIATLPENIIRRGSRSGGEISGILPSSVPPADIIIS
jgi:hypothetical protein